TPSPVMADQLFKACLSSPYPKAAELPRRQALRDIQGGDADSGIAICPDQVHNWFNRIVLLFGNDQDRTVGEIADKSWYSCLCRTVGHILPIAYPLYPPFCNSGNPHHARPGAHSDALIREKGSVEENKQRMILPLPPLLF